VIGSTRSLRVFAYTQPVDMREGFDGLYGLVANALDRDPLSGEEETSQLELTMAELALFWPGDLGGLPSRVVHTGL